jgi:hypothetical protein
MDMIENDGRGMGVPAGCGNAKMCWRRSDT